MKNYTLISFLQSSSSSGYFIMHKHKVKWYQSKLLLCIITLTKLVINKKRFFMGCVLVDAAWGVWQDRCSYLAIYLHCSLPVLALVIVPGGVVTPALNQPAETDSAVQRHFTCTGQIRLPPTVTGWMAITISWIFWEPFWRTVWWQQIWGIFFMSVSYCTDKWKMSRKWLLSSW